MLLKLMGTKYEEIAARYIIHNQRYINFYSDIQI